MNLLNHAALAGLLTIALAAASGCKKDEADPAPSTPETETPAAETSPAEPVEPAPKAAASAEGAETPAESAIAEYETIRAALHKDDVAVAIETAPALKEKAASAAAAAPDEHRPHFEALVKAAEALAATSPDDAVTARAAFGEASRAIVALLASAPELREGRHIFECPMAKGYKKWVQSDEELLNPYMGQKMPHCGSATEWEVGG